MPKHPTDVGGKAFQGVAGQSATLRALADLPRWVAWQTEDRDDGKPPTKVPYQPGTRRKSRANDPGTWGPRAAAEATALPKPYGAGGVGIQLGDLGDGTSLGGIDLDSCRAPDGTLAPWAAVIVAAFGTYAEVSPSGGGVKLFFRYDTTALAGLQRAMGTSTGKKWAKPGAGEHPPAIELYLTGRYFAVTDDLHPTAPAELRHVPAELLQGLIERDGPAFAAQPAAPGDRAQRAAPGGTKGKAGDGSRSAAALRIGATLRRAGKTFDEMCAAMRADPATADWCREKGDAHGGRELRRVWDKAAPEPTDENDDATVTRLSRLSQFKYERVREAEAEKLGLRVGVLDRLVRGARSESAPGGQGRPLDIPPPDPWPDPVDGAALLFALTEFYGTHLYLPQRGAPALALWTLHTHCAEAFAHTPRLIVKSAEKGSGKSTVFDLLKLTTNKPVETESISPAALFRTIEKAKPTILMDEADTFVKENEDLRGLLNAGYKKGGQTIRCVGDDQEPRMFDVFTPVALAGLGNLPGTIVDRSITITMRRARRGELPQPIRRPTEELGAQLARQAARWAADHAAGLAEAEPDMGDLYNRLADVWRPLYAIAAAAGDNWPDLARRVMEALSKDAQDDAEGLGVKLLRDVRGIFAETGRDFLPTAELVAKLVEMTDRPWPEMGKTAKPLTASRFTRMVRDFNVDRMREYDPSTQKMGGWGYRMTDFAEAFERYLSA